jgi:ribosomal protein S18 acetylase RimI-like enzyme
MARLLRPTAREFREWAAEAATVYGEAMQRSPEVVVQRREIIASHTNNRGFVAAVAVTEDTGALIGFGYGYLGAPGQWWHDIVSRALGREAAKRWLRDGFELAELHVAPDHQGEGLGRALLTDVLGRTEAKRAVLSTPDAESPARALYRATGFVDLLTDFYFPGSAEAYVIMGADL